MQRIRVKFIKNGPMRFTSNLDLARAWERTLRRAQLPIVYSQGFNPQPRLNLAAALPLGFTSECELIDIWLEEALDREDVLSRLRTTMPPGLEVLQIDEVELDRKTMQSQLQAIDYRVTLPAATDLAGRINDLLQTETLPRERRRKSYDLRPLILSLEQSEPNHLVMRLEARPGKTGRPDEVLLALELDPLAALIHRTHLIFAEPQRSDESQPSPL